MRQKKYGLLRIAFSVMLNVTDHILCEMYFIYGCAFFTGNVYVGYTYSYVLHLGVLVLCILCVKCTECARMPECYNKAVMKASVLHVYVWRL